MRNLIGEYNRHRILVGSCIHVGLADVYISGLCMQHSSLQDLARLGYCLTRTCTPRVKPVFGQLVAKG